MSDDAVTRALDKKNPTSTKLEKGKTRVRLAMMLKVGRSLERLHVDSGGGEAVTRRC